MSLQGIVCSLAVSKKLEELGVRQDSLFRWQNPLDNLWEPTALKKQYIEMNNSNSENYSAFTAEELLNIIPKKIPLNSEHGGQFELKIQKINSIWNVSYVSPYKIKISFSGEKLEDCAAAILIWLLEVNYIEVGDL